MRIFGYVVLGIIGLFVLMGVLSAFRVIALPFRAVSRGLDTAEGIIDKTLDADNALYNYEWFKQQGEDIRALEKKIVIAERAVIVFEDGAGDRAQWTFEDKTENGRLRAVAQGLRSKYETAVADYNARAKMANRAIFADGLIPNVIEGAASLIR